MNSALFKNLVPEKEKLKNNQKSDLFIWILKVFLLGRSGRHSNQSHYLARAKISRWVDQKAVIHLHSGLVLGWKRGKSYLLWSRNGPADYYAKWNKPVREGQIPYDFTHMWNLRNKNKQNRNGGNGHMNRLTAARGAGTGERRRRDEPKHIMHDK